uniref:C2H2-type domain-containing protein n=1 Tax=Macrostomum lignano TaxID=282301 RepID=A0A1I8HLF0_9PLAT
PGPSHIWQCRRLRRARLANGSRARALHKTAELCSDSRGKALASNSRQIVFDFYSTDRPYRQSVTAIDLPNSQPGTMLLDACQSVEAPTATNVTVSDIDGFADWFDFDCRSSTTLPQSPLSSLENYFSGGSSRHSPESTGSVHSGLDASASDSHTGDRPFPCSLCGRAFSRSDHLALHMKKHQ